MIKDRYYQTEATDSIFNFFAEHRDPKENPVVALPTGTGKSVIIARFIQRALGFYPATRVMMLTRSSKLVKQNYDRLKNVWPQAPVGIYAAKLKRKETGMPITFATIHSVMRAPQKFGKIDLIFVDECQDVSPDEETGYKKTIAFLHKMNPHLRVIGLSATPYRLGLGMITDGGIFTHVCYDKTDLEGFNQFLDEGFLVPLIPFPTETQFDLSGVHKRGGEYIDKEIQDAMTKYDLTCDAVDETISKAASRKHWLFFGQGIAHCEMIVEILRDRGITAAPYHSKMSTEDQEEALAMFEAGEIRALVNGDMLTTGYDFPGLDCIILLRATESPGLHVQILGRGTRPDWYRPMMGHNGGPAFDFDLNTIEGRLASIEASDKQNCLVLDFAGNVSRLGPVNDPRIPKRKGEGSGEIPVKRCEAILKDTEEKCECLNHISARFCCNPVCGAEFTFVEKITSIASNEAIIAKQEAPLVEVFKVDTIQYSKHEKLGAPPSLRVDYYCGVRRFSEWVTLEHPSNARFKAIHWWKQRYPADHIPDLVDQALKAQEYLKIPKAIRVWVNKNKGGKNPQIMSAIFE